MNRKFIRSMLSLLLVPVLLSGCGYLPAQPEETQPDGLFSESDRAVLKEKIWDIGSYPLRDRDLIYANDDETSVVTMYLTVSRGNSAENTDHSWQQINTYSAYDYQNMGVDRYKVNGLLQVGDETGPLPGELGFGEVVPNATVNVRGQTSSRSAQKNYKIELKQDKGLWREQRTINLNKHTSDGLRFRNKLMFDLMKQIPQIMSLRTQFVHLYVKDETMGVGGVFRDYGLYTAVEQLNRTGLRNHGLDVNANLYKINFFEFYRYEDTIMLEDDPDFDKQAFDYLLEIKGNRDHSKLIKMLEAVNDNSLATDAVLDKYFDTENLAYWMAFMILTGNHDTDSRNVFLYSPQNSDKWYLIPWDNDAALKEEEHRLQGRAEGLSWQLGVSNYWGNMLFRRCLKSEKFRAELDAAVEDLNAFLTPERIRPMVEAYQSVVKPYVYRMPDQLHAPLTESNYDYIASTLHEEIAHKYRAYYESYQRPMPFYIGTPVAENGNFHFTWESAFDFRAEDITYTVELARDYQFQNVVYRKEGVRIPEVTTPLREPGQYFLRVRAVNESGMVQDAFDYYATPEGKQYGMKCFYLSGNGRIAEDIYHE